MLMVLNVHSFSAPSNLQILTIGGDLIRSFVDFFREASSISCVNIFILISGYFSIKWKIRSISNLIFQVYFWIFLIYAICLTIGIAEFSFKEFGKHIMGIMTGYWFIPTYIGLYVFAPMLNAFIETHTHKQLLWYIIIFYIFFTLDALPFASNFTKNGYSIYSFIGLYMIGRFLRSSNILKAKIFSSNMKLFLWIILVTMLITIGALFIAIKFNKGGGDLQMFPLSTFAYNNPLVIIQSILIFIYFLKVRIQNNLINWCGTGALAIYLFHMHTNLKQEYYGFANQLYSYSMLNQYLSLILLFITVALIAIPVDKLRAWLFNRVYDKATNLSLALRRKYPLR